MYAQLGNIIFQGLLTPSTFNVEGDEASYAEHELIAGKSRLQLMGGSLQEISFEIKFHAEFCNPKQQIEALKAAKEAGTILPFLLGNGEYTGDYVIISHPYTVDHTFPDGTIIQATVTLTIKEYISYNKLEQKQLAARKAAYAVGDKKPVIVRKPQPEDEIKSISRSITETKQQTTKIDGLVSDYEQNASRRPVIAKRIIEACNQANEKINNLNKQLDEAREVQNRFTAVRSVATTVVTAVTAIKNLFPVNSISDLRSSNVYLQNVIRSFSSVSAPIIETVIVRRPLTNG